MNNTAKAIWFTVALIVAGGALGYAIVKISEGDVVSLAKKPFTAEDARAHSTRIDPIEDTTERKIRYLEGEIKEASDSKEREVYGYLGVGDNREKITSHFRSLGYDVKLETRKFLDGTYNTKIIIKW